MVPGIDPKVDIIFKRLFGTEPNADLLIDLLNAVLDLPPQGVVTAVELLNPFNDKEALDDKLSILDIKARDAAGRQFNVEMQVAPEGDYPERVVYYLTKLHQLQMREGMQYHALEPSYSINFLDHVLFRESTRWQWCFELRDLREPAVVFSNHLTVHVVELPKFNQPATALTTGCERWSYFLRHAEELDTDQLPAPLQTPAIRKAMEILRMLTQSELEREKYEARLKYQRDEVARLRYAEQTGEERGEERGELIGRVQQAERLLKQTLTPKETLRAVSLEELRQLADRLEAQLAERA